jgi:hypothetical protein
VRVYSESLIRSHLVFQLSKITDALLAQLRKTLKTPPFLVISPGRANLRALGHVKQCHSLADYLHVENLLSKSEQIILLLEYADGTEEIPPTVSGVLLKHPLP